MDVSIIDEMPAGRKKIETHWMKKEQLNAVLTENGERTKKVAKHM